MFAPVPRHALRIRSHDVRIVPITRLEAHLQRLALHLWWRIFRQRADRNVDLRRAPVLRSPLITPLGKIGDELRGCLGLERIPVGIGIGDAFGGLGQLDLIQVENHGLPRFDLVFPAIDRNPKVLDLAPVHLGRDLTALLRVPVHAVVRERFERDAATLPLAFLHDGVAIAADFGLHLDAIRLTVHQAHHELLRGRATLHPEGQATRLAVRPQIDQLTAERNVHARVIILEECPEHCAVARSAAGQDLVARLAAIAIGVAPARARDIILEERGQHLVFQRELAGRGRVRLRSPRGHRACRPRTLRRWLGMTRLTSRNECKRTERAKPKGRFHAAGRMGPTRSFDQGKGRCGKSCAALSRLHGIGSRSKEISTSFGGDAPPARQADGRIAGKPARLRFGGGCSLDMHALSHAAQLPDAAVAHLGIDSETVAAALPPWRRPPPWRRRPRRLRHRLLAGTSPGRRGVGSQRHAAPRHERPAWRAPGSVG